VLVVPEIELGEQRIEYSVTRGTSRRYTYFRFRPDATLEIIIPRGRTVNVDSIIRKRQSWIVRRYQELFHSKKVLDGHRLMIGGVYLKLVFEPNRDGEEILVDNTKGEVVVRTNDQTRVNELVRRWFLKETSKYVIKRLSDLSRKIPTKYRRADVREIKNWGYCTRDGRLSFSWQLIALPERLRDYIIFHELTHLSEFNHSLAFKRKLSAFCPDYNQLEKELNQISPMVSQYNSTEMTSRF
jgi:predicted metal-dependent hydrolase